MEVLSLDGIPGATVKTTRTCIGFGVMADVMARHQPETVHLVRERGQSGGGGDGRGMGKNVKREGQNQLLTLTFSFFERLLESINST